MSYSNGLLSSSKYISSSSYHSVGTAGIGFKLTSDGDYDMDTKKLTNLDEVVDNDDAITKYQMEVALSAKPNKNNIYSNKRNLDLQDKYNVVNSKQQSFTHLKANYDNLISFNDANNIFLSRVESFPMKANLNMGNNIIQNVKNDDNDDGVVNKGDVDQADNSLQNKIDQNMVNVGKELIETQGLTDLKS